MHTRPRGRGRGGGGAGRGGRGVPMRGGPPVARHHHVEAPAYVPDPLPAIEQPGPEIAPGVVTVGVPRPSAPGTAGKPVTVITNHFKVTIGDSIFHHYDVALDVGDNAKPIKWNHELIKILQEVVAPDIFTPRAVYDGRKNMYASRRLPFPGGGDTQTFEVSMGPQREEREGGRPPNTYKVTLKHVAEINPMCVADV